MKQQREDNQSPHEPAENGETDMPSAQQRQQQSRSRREFLRVAGTAAVGVVGASLTGAGRAGAAAQGIPTPKAGANKFAAGKYPKGTVLAPGRAIGANERIVVGFVGVGGQGGYHLRNFVDGAADRNTQTVAVCDVYRPFLDRARQYAGEKGGVADVLADKDYRRMLDRRDIDAIMISTPEHWHGQVAVHAMQAGKHVYIEKPMTRYLDEAFQVYDTAMSTKRVVQVGSQGCSDVRWHAAAKAVREGRLGPLVMGQGSYTRNNPKGEWNYGIPAEISPETLDWQMWLGSAPRRPFTMQGPAGDGEQPTRDDSGARFRRYRKYWDYSAGILGDLMPHKLHPFLIASGNPEFPTRVTSIGTHGIQNKDRDVADTVQVLAEFPSGWSMLFVGSTVNEQGLQDMFRGHKGSVYFGNAVEVRPERPFSEEIEGGLVAVDSPDLAGYSRGESVEAHEKDWLVSIRTGKVPNCNVDLATKVQTIVSLAEMSQRTNKTMTFDAKTRKVTAG